MADTMRQTRLREARARERERRGTQRASAAAAAEAACREVYFRDNEDLSCYKLHDPVSSRSVLDAKAPVAAPLIEIGEGIRTCE